MAIFLKDVGVIVYSKCGKDVWKVEQLTKHESFIGRCLPDTIYVVDFPGRGAGQELLLSRQSCGSHKFLQIKHVGHEMIRLFRHQFIGSVAQFIILWGGRPLDILDADPPIYPTEHVDTTYIKLTRVEDTGAARGWSILKSSMVGEWWKTDTWLIMEECIASGKTLGYFAEMAFQHHVPKKLFIFPVCASAEGLEGIYEVCRRYGVAFTAVLNSAIIQVAEKGIRKPYTDLGLQPNTIITKDFYHKLHIRYQGTPICWVGDIGDSLYQPISHLIETLHDMDELQMDFEREDFSEWPSLIHSQEFISAFQQKTPALFERLKGVMNI